MIMMMMTMIMMMIIIIMIIICSEMIMRLVYHNNESECKWHFLVSTSCCFSDLFGYFNVAITRYATSPPQVADALDALGPHRVGNPQVAWIEVETLETLLRCFEDRFGNYSRFIGIYWLFFWVVSRLKNSTGTDGWVYLEKQ